MTLILFFNKIICVCVHVCMNLCIIYYLLPFPPNFFFAATALMEQGATNLDGGPDTIAQRSMLSSMVKRNCQQFFILPTPILATLMYVVKICDS